MNILFLTSRIPYPPNRGDKVRTLFFLKEMSKDHDITLVSFIENESEELFKKELKKYCKKVLLIRHNKINGIVNLVLGIFRSIPFQVLYYRNKKMAEAVDTIVKEENIQIIYTHLIRMAPYVQKLAIKKILDYTDAISMEYKRSIPHRKNLIKKCFYWIESLRTKRYEKHIINDFQEGWFISKEDIHHLELNSDKVHQMPNPVVIDKIKTDYDLTNNLIFVGNLSVQHNISAANYVFNNIMPALMDDHDNLQFLITGADAVPEIRSMSGKRNTRVTGFVQDLYQTLIESDIFVAPMFFSAGVQNKVLEAMAVGLPVITTTNVARSIDAVHKKNIIIADNETEFICCIRELLENTELRTKIGNNGYKLIKNSFSQKLVSSMINERIQI